MNLENFISRKRMYSENYYFYYARKANIFSFKDYLVYMQIWESFINSQA